MAQEEQEIVAGTQAEGVTWPDDEYDEESDKSEGRHVVHYHSLSPSFAERLSDDELAYHRRVWRERREADAQALVTATVMGAWCRHLEAKYDLGPGDHVDEDGAITRKGFTDG